MRSLLAETHPTNTTYITIFALCLLGPPKQATGQPQSQRILWTYGTCSDSGYTSHSFLTNCELEGFDRKNPGLLAIGYFADESELKIKAESVLDSTSLVDFLSNFQPLDCASLQYQNKGRVSKKKIIQVELTGRTPYYLLLEGITSWDDHAKATGIALFTDSSFGKIPMGAANSLISYKTEKSHFDTVLIGQGHLGMPPQGNLPTPKANLYATAPIPAQGKRVMWTYGICPESESSPPTLLTDSNLEAFAKDLPGFLAIGYFHDEGEVASKAASVKDTGTLLKFLSNFQHLDCCPLESQGQGQFSMKKIVTVERTGCTPYLLILEGVDRWEDRAKAKGIALLTDSSFGKIPDIRENSLVVYKTMGARFDSVVLGQGHFGIPPFGELEPMTGNLYSTMPIPSKGKRLLWTYGIGEESEPTRLTLLTNSTKAAFNRSNPGLVALGCFTDDTGIKSKAGKVRDRASLLTFLSNFQPLDCCPAQDQFRSQFSVRNLIKVERTGGTPYLLVLEGVTSWKDRAKAKGIALLKDTSFGKIPWIQDNTIETDNPFGPRFDSVILGEADIGSASNYQRSTLAKMYSAKSIHAKGQAEATGASPEAFYFHVKENTPKGAIVGTMPNDLPGSELWKYPLSKAPTSSPAIGPNGKIFIGYQGNLVALNPLNGSQEWSLDEVEWYKRLVGNYPNSMFFTPSIGTDGTVYVGTSHKTLYALSSQNGEKLWEFRAGECIFTPAIGAEGLIFAYSNNRTLYALDAKTGQLKWRKTSMSEIPVVGHDGTVYSIDKNCNLVAMDPATGRERWQFQVSSYSGSFSFWGNDTMFAMTSNWLFALNPTDGQLRWSIAKKYLSSHVVGPDGTVYLASYAKVSALDPLSGAVKWNIPVERHLRFSPKGTHKKVTMAFGGDHSLYVQTPKEVLCLSSTGGAKRWGLPYPESTNFHPAIGEDGVLYTVKYYKNKINGTDRGEVIAIKGSSSPPKTGWPMWGFHSGRTLNPTTQLDYPTQVLRGKADYELLRDTNSSDNESFELEGDQLRTSQSFDYEVKNVYRVRILANYEDKSITREYSIAIDDVPEAPTGISASETRFIKDTWRGMDIATLTAKDQDFGESHHFELVDSPDGTPHNNALFVIKDGMTLSVGDYPIFGFSDETEYTVHVRVTDKDGLQYSQELVFTVYEPVQGEFGEWLLETTGDNTNSKASEDLDGDGRPNLLEYALGSDPNLEDNEESGPSLSLGENQLSLTFVRRKQSADPAIQFRLQMSHTLESGSWQDVEFIVHGQAEGVDQSGLPDDEPLGASLYERVRIYPQDLAAVQDGGCFFRIVVSLP